MPMSRHRSTSFGRHQQPQDRIDEDLASRNDHQNHDEQDSREPWAEVEPTAQAGEDAGEHSALAWANQTLAVEALNSHVIRVSRVRKQPMRRSTLCSVRLCAVVTSA